MKKFTKIAAAALMLGGMAFTNANAQDMYLVGPFNGPEEKNPAYQLIGQGTPDEAGIYQSYMGLAIDIPENQFDFYLSLNVENGIFDQYNYGPIDPVVFEDDDKLGLGFFISWSAADIVTSKEYDAVPPNNFFVDNFVGGPVAIMVVLDESYEATVTFNCDFVPVASGSDSYTPGEFDYFVLGKFNNYEGVGNTSYQLMASTEVDQNDLPLYFEGTFDIPQGDFSLYIDQPMEFLGEIDHSYICAPDNEGEISWNYNGTDYEATSGISYAYPDYGMPVIYWTYENWPGGEVTIKFNPNGNTITFITSVNVGPETPATLSYESGNIVTISWDDFTTVEPGETTGLYIYDSTKSYRAELTYGTQVTIEDNKLVIDLEGVEINLDPLKDGSEYYITVPEGYVLLSNEDVENVPNQEIEKEPFTYSTGSTTPTPDPVGGAEIFEATPDKLVIGWLNQNITGSMMGVEVEIDGFYYIGEIQGSTIVVEFSEPLAPGEYTAILEEGVVLVNDVPNAYQELTFEIEGEAIEGEFVYLVAGEFNDFDPDFAKDALWDIEETGIEYSQMFTVPAGQFDFFIAALSDDDEYYIYAQEGDTNLIVEFTDNVFQGSVYITYDEEEEGSHWTCPTWTGGNVTINYYPLGKTIEIIASPTVAPETEAVDPTEILTVSNGVVFVEYTGAYDLWFDAPSNAYGYVLDEDGEEVAVFGSTDVTYSYYQGTQDAYAFTINLANIDLEVGNYYIYIPEGNIIITYAEDYSDDYVNAEIRFAITLDKPTGVSSINAIDGDAVIYNMNGVRVDSNKLTKGIYIINGKKVAIK